MDCKKRKRVTWSTLTRKPAVVVAVTVVAIKLRRHRSGVTHQQEDEAHPCHFGTWERFAHCHLQKVNMALTTFLRYVLKSSTYLEIRCSKTMLLLPRLFPRLLHALTSIKVVQPSFPRSPNPSYPAPTGPFLPQALMSAQNLYYPTPFKLRWPLFPAHLILLSSLYPCFCFFLHLFTCFLPFAK